MVPNNTNGVADVRVIRWNRAHKDGFGIHVVGDARAGQMAA